VGKTSLARRLAAAPGAGLPVVDAKATPFRERFHGRLGEAGIRCFHDHDAAPLLIVNAGDADLARSGADFAVRPATIERGAGGRHRLHPAGVTT